MTEEIGKTFIVTWVPIRGGECSAEIVKTVGVAGAPLRTFLSDENKVEILDTGETGRWGDVKQKIQKNAKIEVRVIEKGEWVSKKLT